MIIKVSNLLSTLAQQTYLTQSENLGTGTLHVKNANSFNAKWAIQIGNTGEEQTEIVLLNASTPSGTTLTLASNTQFVHPVDTPVYAIKYNQVIFLRSTSGTGGAASAFATTNITPDGTVTAYDDTTGAATYAYKAEWYNSSIPSTSSVSDWITPAGYDFYSLAKIRQRIKNKLLNAGFIGTDDVIDDWINEYLEMMTNVAIDVDEDYNLGTTSLTFSGTAQLGTITAADFKQVHRAWISYDGVTSYEMRKVRINQYQPQQVFNETYPYFYMQGDNQFGRLPYDKSATVSLLYYKLNTVLVNDGDCLPIPMRGYTNGFVNYALAQALYKDSRTQEAGLKEQAAGGTLERFKRELSPRNKTGESFIHIVENVEDNLEPLI